MSAKGSKLSRALDYFREGNLDEVEFVLSKALVIVKNRQQGVKVAEVFATSPIVKRKRNRGPNKVKTGVAAMPDAPLVGAAD